MATGTIGAPAIRATPKQPGLSGSTSRPLVVVPSGKLRIEAPPSSVFAMVRSTQAPLVARERATNWTPAPAQSGPITGQRRTSSLAIGSEGCEAITTSGSR